MTNYNWNRYLKLLKSWIKINFYSLYYKKCGYSSNMIIRNYLILDQHIWYLYVYGNSYWYNGAQMAYQVKQLHIHSRESK